MPMTQGAALGRTPQDQGFFRDSADNCLKNPFKQSSAARAKDNHTALPYCIISQCYSCCPDMLTSRCFADGIATFATVATVATVAIVATVTSTTVRPFVRYRYSRLRPVA